MSKIGDKPIIVETDTQVKIDKEAIEIRGREGAINLAIPSMLTITSGENKILVKANTNEKKERAMQGLFRSVLNNAVLGVNKPWTRRLEIVGTGYRVKIMGSDLSFEVGFSHPVIFKSVEGIKLSIDGTNKVIVSGVDKQLVEQVAYKIKKIKRPDPYKGKGIKNEGEKIKLRPGKKAKSAEGAK